MMATTALLFLALLQASPQRVGAAIVPNENLVLDGVPPIPRRIAEAVLRYTEFRAASFVAWHPVKREMLIATRFGDTSQLHWVKGPGAFAPDGRSAYVTTDQGSEFLRLARLDLGTGAFRVLVPEVGGTSRASTSPQTEASWPSSPTKKASRCCTSSTPGPGASSRCPRCPSA